MDREILLTGVGGQGVQLAAKILALAGMLEGRCVMQFSMFGGTMRGGASECTVVIADGAVEAPPIVPHAWAAVAMHASTLGQLERKLRPGSPVVYNPSAIAHPPSRPDCRWIPIEATTLASAAGNPGGQSLVALGAFQTLTRLVSAASLEEALAQLLPAYRRSTLAANLECLRAGAAAFAELAGTTPAWGEREQRDPAALAEGV